MGVIRVGFFLAVLAWVLLGPAAGARAAQLVIFGEEPGKVLTCLPLETGKPLYFEFINSIYLAPVRETLVYEEGEGIFIVRVESPSAGVFEYYGLEPDGTGRAELHRKVGEIRIRSHNYENHRLTVGDRTLRLKEIAKGGESLIVEVRACERGCGP
jgi:hypothetical protein